MRLYHGYGVNRLHSAFEVRTQRVKVSLLGKFWFNRGLIVYNSIWKHTLLKLGDFSTFRSSYRTNLSQSARHLLPIQHFCFAGSLYQKIRMGLRGIATITVPSIIASCRNRYRSLRHGMVHFFTGNQDRSILSKIPLKLTTSLACELSPRSCFTRP